MIATQTPDSNHLPNDKSVLHYVYELYCSESVTTYDKKQRLKSENKEAFNSVYEKSNQPFSAKKCDIRCFGFVFGYVTSMYKLKFEYLYLYWYSLYGILIHELHNDFKC